MFEYQNTNTDIYYFESGEQVCIPSHDYGPAVRDYFLIHYIIKGKGIFRTKDREYELQSKQGFIIHPNKVTYYKADRKDPWHYIWVGFNGKRAKEYLKLANLSEKNPIFTYDLDDEVLTTTIRKMTRLGIQLRDNDFELMAHLYMYLSMLADNNCHHLKVDKLSNKDKYLQQSFKYVQANYWHDLTVEDLSNHLNLNRSYLYTIFKEELNLSPQQYIINFRINKAVELLNNQELTIAEVARSVGYQDQFIFSKTFKKQKGLSPKIYRLKKIEKH
ncbi:AraC family transcriptional regulator [Vallitalea okinawensis]|uniref:AraC family transcriptional regulator n=1 Tax=Vallitalea okinawensis TaxID=2078660 RepID=UPI000CFDD4A9|nr:AraC family transcriptional regulator [Vallitalea okinawensis]